MRWGQPCAEWIQWLWSSICKILPVWFENWTEFTVSTSNPKTCNRTQEYFFYKHSFVNTLPISQNTGKNSFLSSAYFKILGAESTNIQHKQTAPCSTTAMNREQKCRWQQHQKNTALDPRAGVHLGIRTQRLVQQQALNPWRKPWLAFLGKKRSTRY